MLAVKRREGILDLLSEEKSASVSSLANKFKVTEETIRRDLDRLAKDGKLNRTHGGAFIQDGVENSIDVNIREMAYVSNKKQIAKAAKSVIRNGDTIFLDPSTTALFLAKAISELRLTVVTNSLLIAQALAEKENIRLVLLGGNLHRKHMCFTGQYTNMILKELCFDKAFISSRSVSLNEGVTDSSDEISEIRKNALAHSNECYLISDYTKFDKTSFIKICDLSDLKGIITENILSDAWLDYMNKKGISYISAS